MPTVSSGCAASTACQARLKALTDFYYGPVWQAHREQANPMLYDNDNVLLLHPVATGSGFVVDAGKRPAVGDRPVRNDFVVGTIYYFEQPVPEAFVAQFEQELKPLFEKSGAHVLARYVSEKSPNTFARLPVREKDNVFVWFAGFADRQAYDQYIDRLATRRALERRAVREPQQGAAAAAGNAAAAADRAFAGRTLTTGRSPIRADVSRTPCTDPFP